MLQQQQGRDFAVGRQDIADLHAQDFVEDAVGGGDDFHFRQLRAINFRQLRAGFAAMSSGTRACHEQVCRRFLAAATLFPGCPRV